MALNPYLAEHGIEQTMSPSYSPNLNGIAERTNRTLVESARSMLERAELPRVFWAEGIVHAARIRNIFFCPRDSSTTSYEVMHGSKPVVSYLKILGSLAWNHIPKDNRRKLDAKSEQGIVIECYENTQHKLWVPSQNVATVSSDVNISDNIFPGAKKLDWNGVDLLARIVREGSDHPFQKTK